jgi:hypothetical protein
MTETVSWKVKQLPETWAYLLLLIAIFVTLMVLAMFLGVKTVTGLFAAEKHIASESICVKYYQKCSCFMKLFNRIQIVK